MAATGGTTQQEEYARQEPGESGLKKDVQKVEQGAQKAERRFAPLIAFWTKINNDGIFNSSATLAYTFLVSIFPIFLVILAIAGFVLRAISPQNLAKLYTTLAGGLPGGANGAGGQIVKGVLHQLNHSAGVFLILGILGAIIAGSGLFLTLESTFDTAFRLKSRDPIPQRIMAISLVLLYVVLVPIMVFASILPSVILKALQIGTHNPGGAFLIQLLGLLVAFVSACLFFGSIYFIVPNRLMKVGDIWKGTLLAAVLLVLYELVFPLYESLFLHPNSYGSLVGFAIVILTFFYYLGFIVLLGAEVNSMAIGLGPMTQPINAILAELQQRDVMIEPADSPTTTSAQSSAQTRPSQGATSGSTSGIGDSATISSYVESTRAPALSQQLVAQTSPKHSLAVDVRQSTLPPMTKSQRAALAAVVVTGTIAVILVIRAGKRLMLGDGSTGT